MLEEAEMDNGIVYLRRMNNTVDYIITHCPCSSMFQRMSCDSDESQGSVLTDYLQMIFETVVYKHWFFGHMHKKEPLKGNGKAAYMNR